MKTTIGLFMGGVSVEHEISVISALQTKAAIDAEKYDVIPVYIAKDAKMYVGQRLSDIDFFSDMEALLSSCRRVALERRSDGVYLVETACSGFMRKRYRQKLDLAFPVVHGTNCEDGTIQGLFESLRLPYVGCDILSSALGMDKALMKQVLAQNRLPVVPYASFYSRDFLRETDRYVEEIERLSYPVIVKPANLGSSIGISKAGGREELLKAIEFASGFALKIVVEKAITALREINCSVLGDYSSAQTSACEEPVQDGEILSYSGKYLSGGSSKGMSGLKRKCPAELSAEKEEEIRSLAVQTFNALGASGVARIDFLIDTDDGDKVYINEINTIPGSLSFYLWKESKKSFPELTEELISLAFKRERERANLIFSFDKNIFAVQGTSGLTGKK